MMFCSSCGKEIDENAVVCVHCGCAVPGAVPLYKEENKGKMMFCSNCGKEINESAVVCVHCGCAVPGKASALKKDGKSKVAAGLLAILGGGLGLHNFYLGHKNKAILQLVLAISGWILSGAWSELWWYLPSGFDINIGALLVVGIWIWCLVEGIQCFTGTYKDAQGRDLID